MANTRRKGMTYQRRERANDALRLRLQGLRIIDIAEKHGVSHSTTSQDISLALKEITRESAEQVLEMELQRLDEMLARLNGELAQLAKARRGDLITPDKAINAATRIIDSQLKVQERRARLLGLDTIKHEVDTQTTGAFTELLETLRGHYSEDSE